MPLTDDISLARSPDTSPEALALLAGGSWWEFRGEVARNPDTSPETLARLAGDE
jgi:Leucine rich repeat variant